VTGSQLDTVPGGVGWTAPSVFSPGSSACGHSEPPGFALPVALELIAFPFVPR